MVNICEIAGMFFDEQWLNILIHGRYVAALMTSCYIIIGVGQMCAFLAEVAQKFIV